MAMIGRADSNGVDRLLHLLKHFAEIVVLLRVRPAGCGQSKVLVIDVANRDHIARAAGVLRIARSLAADADASELNLFVRRAALTRGDSAEGPITGANDRRGLQK